MSDTAKSDTAADNPPQEAGAGTQGPGPSRRLFLSVAAGSLASLSAAGVVVRAFGRSALVILERADGVLVADPTRCVGCRRCELACTEWLDGRAQPSIARIKVGRNLNFSVRGQQQGTGRSEGQFGNLRIIVDVCLQCPHPVPCEFACPSQAFVVEPKTKARVVDETRCVGCRLCLNACPWEMISFDAGRAKALKCSLCAGAPPCVEACPAQALQYVSWRNLTGAVPVRRALVATRGFDDAGCAGCHRPKR